MPKARPENGEAYVRLLVFYAKSDHVMLQSTVQDQLMDDLEKGKLSEALMDDIVSAIFKPIALIN